VITGKAMRCLRRDHVECVHVRLDRELRPLSSMTSVPDCSGVGPPWGMMSAR